MSARSLPLLLAAVLVGLGAPAAAQDASSPPDTADALTPPSTRTVDSADVYHGTRVPAPYRWLEEIDSEATRAWVEKQNAYTRGHLRRIPERARIGERLWALWDYPKYGVPRREGGYRYHTENSGLQNHSVVYVQPTEDDAEPRVLFAPNAWSEEGTVSRSGLRAKGLSVRAGLQHQWTGIGHNLDYLGPLALHCGEFRSG